MKKLLNVLYVTNPNVYLSRDGENVVIKEGENELARIPIHLLESIVAFNYLGMSPALMGLCAERGVTVSFVTEHGKFLATIHGPTSGNVLLRRQQYRLSQDAETSATVAGWLVAAKIANCRVVLQRAIRDHGKNVDADKLRRAGDRLRDCLDRVSGCTDLSVVRGIEGEAANVYFSSFNELIVAQKEDFAMDGRTRRPPRDNMNAILSFLYTLLTNDMRSALETVGLDPAVGFLHRDRPGRPSLALDLIEELRPYLVDRLALSLVNRKQVSSKGFEKRENQAVSMTADTRNAIISAWQRRKQEVITHPFLKEKTQIGLLPYVQALLMARYIRGDLDAYPPFFWQ